MQANKSTLWVTVWTVIANMLILVGLGHGTGFLIIVEIILPALIAREGLTFSLNDVYSHLLTTAALFSLPGQLCLGFSIVSKRKAGQLFLAIAGLLFLYTGLMYLTINAREDNEALTGFVTAIPFMCLTVLLLFNLLTGFQFKFPVAPGNKPTYKV